MLNSEIEKVSKQGAPRARPHFLGGSGIEDEQSHDEGYDKSGKYKNEERAGGQAAEICRVRKGIDGLLKKKALELVTKAIEQPGEGHLPAMKYLFEVTGLYPVPDED